MLVYGELSITGFKWECIHSEIDVWQFPIWKGVKQNERIIAAAGVFVAVTLYSCIRAGAQEDQRMEEMRQRGEWDAGRKDRQPEPGEG